MSMNLLLPREDEAVIWRGPLLAGAVKQFWGDVLWGKLDYMLLDLPPGTGDVPLTAMQSLPLEGVLLVTSPQELAGMVVRKAARMAAQLEIPILGVVENMSYAVCPHCGEELEIFGPSHLDAVCESLGTEALGRIPLDSRIALLCDRGEIEDYLQPVLDDLVEAVLSRVLAKVASPVGGEG